MNFSREPLARLSTKHIVFDVTIYVEGDDDGDDNDNDSDDDDNDVTNDDKNMEIILCTLR